MIEATALSKPRRGFEHRRKGHRVKARLSCAQPADVLRRRVVAMFVVVVAGASILASDSPGGAGLVGSGRNGLIAYSYAGDIYVGDPVTGETKPIVTNPAYEAEPIFSPNGRRIAFIRGNPQTANAKLVVVRPDGSDERLILPRGREHRGFGSWGWTPNGDGLVVELDRRPFTYPSVDGELSLFDSFGRHQERVLTPPLRRAIGGHYWGHDQVAPMFRPPSGDRIVSGDWNNLRVFNRRLTRAVRPDDALEVYEPYFPGGPTWSPDGTQIAFWLRLTTGLPTATSPGVTERKGGGLFVISDDGHHLRRIRIGEGATFFQWSPDGSKIAVERVSKRDARVADRAVLVIFDLKSGKKRPLHSTSARGKDAGARFPTTSYNNIFHHWFYEGWVWSPDGRRLLVLENHRTHPWVVDIETDTVTKLPWLADSMPSWQRVTRR